MDQVPAGLQSALEGRYVLERELGRGGMATVYLARDLRHDRPVALKVLDPALAATLGPERFVREVQLTARLQHPHILPVFDSGQAAGQLWYTMPYVEGESLRNRLNREKQLPLEDALQFTRNVLAALSYAHAHGIVHRDIKPENILLESGEAVVADFGVAQAIEAAGGEKLTATGLAVGTPVYMSPEQAAGGAVDARSDLYSLGCVLYEMLAGAPPFTGPTAQAVLARKSMEAVPSLRAVREAVPEAIEHAITTVLAKVPADRYANAARFSEALSTGVRSGHVSGRTRATRARWIAGMGVAVIGIAIATTLATHRPGAAPHTVAVLNFDYLSPDTADAYLADGLTEEITSRLGEVGRLQVKGRNAVRRFRGASLPDMAAIGRTLGVGFLVEGSVRRAGDRVRASIRLVDARTGFRVWGDDYDRATRELLSLQEDIARDVAIQIAGRLLPAEQAVLTAHPTANPEAYDRFLRGNYYLAQRTPRAIVRAIEEYQTASRLDPGFTAAHARAAYGYALYLEWGWPYPGLPAESLLARGMAAADRAMAGDSAAADAWMARAYLLAHQYPRTLAGVREAFERAIALDPRNAEAWHQYGWMLATQADDSGAIAAFQRALAIEPERPVTLLHLAVVENSNRHLTEALRWLDSALALDPSFHFAWAYRALVRLRLTDAFGALADAQTAIRLGGEESIWGEAALAIVQAFLGDTVTARARGERLAARALRADTPGVDVGWPVAAALIALGERDRPLKVLERIRPRGAHLWFDLRIPEFDPIRSDPRFERIVAEARWSAGPP
jgi:eukaryotic-like serine/threonine-protein kinase